MVEAVSVEAVGGGAKFSEKRVQGARAARCPRRRAARASSPAALARCRRLHPRSARARPQGRTAPPSSSSRIRPSWSSTAGRPSSRRRTISCSTRVVPLSARTRDRHPGRSGDARSVQQPVHVDRRADGRVAAEHRLLGQHQGAARLLLRGVRRRRHAGRQRAAHAGASRLDGPRGRDHHPREQGQHRAGRRLRHQRALQRRHASARHHRLHAGVRRRRSKTILFWVASRGHHADVGGISPGSMSPNATTIEEEGVYIDNFKLVDRGRFREKELHDAAHRREISGAQSGAERQRPEGADRRQREGRAGAAQDGRAVHAAGGARPTCSTCRTTPPRACAA